MKLKYFLIFFFCLFSQLGCEKLKNKSNPTSSSLNKKVQIYLQQQLEKDKQEITHSLNIYFQCQYDYSPRKAENCSHILIVPDEIKVAGNWFGLLTNQNYAQEEIAKAYFKFHALLPSFKSDEDLKLPYQIIDQGIKQVCSNLGQYQIEVTADRRSAKVICGNEQIFHLEYWNNHWKVILK